MIKIIEYTKEPLSLIGEIASTCWNSIPSKDIAIKCLTANHGRVLEYPDVTLEISGYSARIMREFYTHSIGISKLQASTRYIDYGEFDFFIPSSITSNTETEKIYKNVMQEISKAYRDLQRLKIPKEDISNILPLGMTTIVVSKLNLRAILHMFEERTCARAYHEYRELMRELREVLCSLDEDWRYIITRYAKIKCEKVGFCIEEKSCGKFNKKI